MNTAKITVISGDRCAVCPKRGVGSGNGNCYVAPGWRPPVGLVIRVVYAGQERMAYLDAEGKWRKETNGDVLTGPVAVLGLQGAFRDRDGVWLGSNPSEEEIEAFCKMQVATQD